MEGKKLSFVDELFPQKETAPSSKSDILSSIFPPRSSGAAKDCSHYEASGVMTGRKLGGDGQSLNEQSGTSGGSPHGSPNKRPNISKKNNSPVMLCEIAEPCLMSSSVHYGGRDDFIPDSSSSRYSGTPYNFKKDNEDNNSDIATRGEWWQGSYYY